MGEADLGVKENSVTTGLSRSSKACEGSHWFVARFNAFGYTYH